MKSFWMTALFTSAALLGLPIASAQASSIFDQQEVDPNNFVLMATPYQGGTQHQLTVIGQTSDERDCWSEHGSQPTAVTPLLLNFDFSGICTRGVDGNGYSIRMDGEDKYLTYTPRIVEADGELQLIASPNREGLPSMVIARSYGSPRSFSKLMFQPGWRLTKRRFEDKVLGHLYLTHDSAAAQPIAQSSTQSIPLPVVQEAPAAVAATPAISTPDAPSPQAKTSDIYLRQVTALYREITGKEIGAEAADLYARLLRNGASLQLLRADMADGDAVETVLHQIYQDLRGAKLSDVKLQHYRDRLKQGWSLAEVEWDVMQSSTTQPTLQSSRLSE